MTRMGRTLLWISIAVFSLSGIQTAPGMADEHNLKLIPELINMGAFYSGAQVRVEGVAETGANVVVIVRGDNKEESFNKKVRAGPIWINSGEVHISEAPSLFLSFSAEPLSSYMDRAVIDQYGLDEEAVKSHMHIDAGSDVVDENVMRDNYLTYKKERGIYQSFSDGVVLGTAQGLITPYSVEFNWPKTAPPDDYEVRVYEYRDGELIRETTAPLSVVKTGFPARMYEMAMQNAPLYGAMAVILAIIAGFGIDFLTAKLFGSKRAAAH